ncbi:DUF3267 domain-containing protein [Natrialba asiatica]|uniref:DUF3267 domain-containing protein n=1 Tax=Natrialba asiatica (strain ATCC 700177 / DSM 12278 / JCM 9576 / FERM P-10747 / NBRC 102637 / 172P1) TaxID=29540 RepID=M0B8H0_NATA1|nr:DUF3267 domain-containing protein [Natrialba asiatica]ELZ05944.1 hypothetical protein C481_00380 [Natrialba asiatica DSM 12278]
MHERDTSHLLAEFTPTRRVVVEWTVLGLGLTLVAGLVGGTVYAAGTGQTDIGFQISDYESALNGFVWAALLTVAVIGLHEAIHAAVIRRYGGDASFGLGIAQFALPYAYVTTTQRLNRNQFIVVSLAPIVVITALGVPLMLALDAPVLIVPLALNAGGAIGDLWMAGVLLRFPSHVVVEDFGTGMRIYGRTRDEPVRLTRERTLLKRTVLGTTLCFGLLLLVGAVTPVLLGLLGVQSFTLGVPDSPWNVFSFTGGSTGFEARINPLGGVAVSVVLGVVYALGTASRTQTT